MLRLKALQSEYLIVLATAALLAATLSISYIYYLAHPGILPGFANKDFANYWMAARLMFEGRTMDLFGPQPQYFAHLRNTFGPLFPWHNWSYPPHYLLLIWPLGFFGYKWALMLFLASTGAFFFMMLRAFAGKDNVLALVAAGPFAVHNFWAAQNGYMFAGLALGALAFRDKRPMIAGIMLGLLTVKPQLGVLFPFLLIAERRWMTMVIAAATCALMVALSAAIFGVSSWQGYVRDVLPYQALVMRELEGTFLAMLPSVYGTMRNWGFGPDAALTMHAVVALPVCLICLRAFLVVRDSRARSVILLIGTFLVTPYALSYDLGLLVGALVLIPALGDHSRELSREQRILLVIAMLMPAIMMPLGELKLSFAPMVLIAVFILALLRSGLEPRSLFPRCFHPH